ncbi:hypothetical protein V6N13_012922 [Hibiscus sabdariffa]|uniref:Uncharacterized protein n=1 Tax=Hibiscus sabdariffa TaxID=183260 RepID=A0ABR2SGM3_9ROSI
MFQDIEKFLGGCGGQPPNGYDPGEDPSETIRLVSPTCMEGTPICMDMGNRSNELIDMEGVEQIHAMNETMEKHDNHVVVEDTEILKEPIPATTDIRKVSYAAMAAKGTVASGSPSNGGGLG